MVHILQKILVLHTQKEQLESQLHGVPSRTHSGPLFTKVCILTIGQLYKLNIGLTMYEFHRSLLPLIFNEMFE